MPWAILDEAGRALASKDRSRIGCRRSRFDRQGRRTARMERRLTAILAADVVGYSRLMGEDEVGTLERLKSCRRELIDPAIKEFHGRMIKLMGDGALVEFASVVDAVQCAAVIQRRMVDRNKGTAEAQQIRFRIGVNLGDVIVEGDDIYGDGVNIAARLEAMAEPGGVCISGTAFDHAVHKVDVGFASLGEQRLKNIADPVRAYRVLLDPAASGKIVAAPRRPGSRVMILAGAAALADRRCLPAFLRGKRVRRAVAAIGCRAAVCKPRRRSQPGLFRRRHHRGFDHRPHQAFRSRCHRPQFRLRLQGQACGADRRRARSWRPLRRRRQRPPHRRADPPQCPAHRHGNRRQSVGRPVRPRHGRTCLPSRTR